MTVLSIVDQMTTYYNTQALSGTSFAAEVQSAFQTCYWFFTVISVFLAIEGVVVSVYTVVFGQALALRGPAGSMIRAVNAFEREQRLVLILFSLSIFFLGIGTIFQMYVVMDWLSAHLCASVAAILMYHWYVHCMDVYNRYNYTKESVEWTKHDDYRRSQVLSDDLENRHNFDNNPLHQAERDRLARNLRREPSMGFITIMSDPADVRAAAAAEADAAFAAKMAGSAAGDRPSFFQYVFGKRDSERTSDQVDPYANAYFGSQHAQEYMEPLMRESAAADVDMAGRGSVVRGSGGSGGSLVLPFAGEVEFRGAGAARGDRRYIVVTESTLSFHTSEAAYREAGAAASCCKTQKPLDLSQYCYRVVPGSGADPRDVVLLTLISAMHASTVGGRSHTIEFRCGSNAVAGDRSWKVDTDKLTAAIAKYSPPAKAVAMPVV